jgi:hypothetical protein
MILATNPKTEEIVLVWATEDLDSVALGLKELQNHLRQRRKVVMIPRGDLRPLSQTVMAALDRHRRIFRKPTDIEELKRIKFDLMDAFSTALEEGTDELKASVPRRRVREKKLAIESISESDLGLVKALLQDSQRQALKREELASRLEALCEKIELD